MNTLGLKTAKLLVDSIWNNNNNHTNDTLQSRDQLESSINIFIHFISNNNDNNNKNRSSLTYPDLIVLIKMLYIYLNRYSDISSIFQSQIYQLLMSIKQSAITSTTQIMTANSIGVSAFEELSDITQKLQTQSISSFSSHQDVSSNAKTSQLLQILLLDVLIVSLSDTARISRNNKKIFTKFCQVLLADSLKLIGYLSLFRVPTIAFLDASTTTQSGSAKINISSSAIVSQIIKNYQDLWSVALFSDSNILDSLVSYQFPVKLSSSLSSSTSHILGQTNTHTHSVTSNPVNSLDNESSHHLLEQDTKPDVEVEAVEDVTISNNNKESKRVIGTAYYTLLFDVILEVIPQLQTTSSATATTYTSTSINTEGEESAQCIYEESSTSLGLLFASIISSAKRQFTLNGSYHDSKYEKQNINGTNSKSISNTINSEKKIQYFERVLQLFFLFYKLIQVSANSSSTSEMDMSSNQNKRQKLLSNKPNSDSATNAISSTTNVFTANSTISSLWMLKARNSLLSLLTTEFSNSIPYHKSLLAHQQRLQDLAKQWIIQASASNSGGASASTGSRATDVSRVQSYSVSDAFLTLQLEAIHMLMIIDHRTVLSLKDLLPTNTTQTSTASTITDTETTTATASSNPASKKRPIQKQSSTVAVVGDGGNPMYTLLEILVEYDSNSIIKNSDNSNNSGNDSSSSVSHSKGGNVALLSVKKRVLCRIIDTLAKLQR